MYPLPILFCPFPIRTLVWVWMTYAMVTDTFKDTPIPPPMEGPEHHVVLSAVVYHASILTLRYFGMSPVKSHVVNGISLAIPLTGNFNNLLLGHLSFHSYAKRKLVCPNQSRRSV